MTYTKSRFLNSSRLMSLTAKVCFTYVSHEIMTPDCASAVEPSTSNCHLSPHVFDSVHRLKMFGRIFVVEEHVAPQYIICALPLTTF